MRPGLTPRRHVGCVTRVGSGVSQQDPGGVAWEDLSWLHRVFAERQAGKIGQQNVRDRRPKAEKDVAPEQIQVQVLPGLAP